MKDSELESVFEAVLDQVLEISARWKLYLQLFDSGKDNLDMLNASGSYVFGIFQRLLIYDVVLAIARLTDPVSSTGKRNASLRSLYATTKEQLSGTTIEEVETLLSALDSHAKEIRLHRNKALAHADLKHVETLPGIAYDNVEAAIAGTQRLTTILGAAVGHQIQHFDVTFRFGTDGRKLLQLLRLGHSIAQDS